MDEGGGREVWRGKGEEGGDIIFDGLSVGIDYHDKLASISD